MNDKLLKEELEKWKTLYSGACVVIRSLERQLESLASKAQIAEMNLKNAQDAVLINKTLLRQVTEENNKNEKELIEFMNRLKAKLREMGYNGSFDRLGQ
jgi:hypothetical protein